MKHESCQIFYISVNKIKYEALWFTSSSTPKDKKESKKRKWADEIKPESHASSYQSQRDDENTR